MMKKYSAAMIGACALMMSSLVWSNDAPHGDAHKSETAKDAHAAAPAAKAESPVAKADTAAAPAPNQSTKPARKKKGRAAKKAAEASAHADAAHVAPSAAAEQAKRIRVRQRGELASAVDAAQSGHASAAEPHAVDTHSPAPAAVAPVAASVTDRSSKNPNANGVSDGRASAVVEDRYMPVTKSVETPAVEQSSYSLLDRHPAEYVRPAGEMVSREAEPVVNHAEPVRVETPAKVVAVEPRQVVEPVVATSKPTPAQTSAADPVSTVQDSALACNPPLKSEVAALFDRWNASLRTGDPKKVVANYAPYSVLLPTVSNRARFTAAEKEDYFHHFLERKPEGKIDDRVIEVDCNSATDSGLYTFRFADGTSVRARYSFSYKRVGNDWLISSHHSSGMPEQPPKVVVQAVEEKAVEKPAPKKVVERSENWQRPDGWVRFP